ncbi:hypothetical protein HDU67_000681, partial [Dinochytrium kinnereticum]
FDIYETESGGASGRCYRSNKQRLNSAFGTDDMDEILKRILRDGKVQKVPMDRRKLS